MDTKLPNASDEDLITAFRASAKAAAGVYHSAIDAAAEAAVAAFQNALHHRKARTLNDDRESILSRYRERSWKRDVLECAYELVPEPPGSFRFSDIAKFEKRLKRNHPDQVALMSGVNVTLQGLVKDGVLGNPARGLYTVK